MINRLDIGESRDILNAIEAEDAKLFETIRHLMFVFEDLMQLDIRDLKELIQRIDRKLLTIALKGTSDQLKARIMSVMSQRSADMLREDIEVIGAVKIREVEAAQQQHHRAHPRNGKGRIHNASAEPVCRVESSRRQVAE